VSMLSPPNPEQRDDAYPLFALSSLQLEPLPAGAFDRAVKLGDACRDSHLWGGAIPHYVQALRLRPSAVRIQVQLGNMLKECGRHAEAEQCYIAAVANLPDDADIFLQLGHLMNKRANYPKAHAYYSRALRLNPQSPDIAHHLGWAEQQLRRLGMPVPTEYPTDRAEALKIVSTGDAHGERGDWVLAAECYSYALSLNASDPGILHKLESAYREHGQPVFSEQLAIPRSRWNLRTIGIPKLSFTDPRR
jgi:tetratricopeptide (TPR) repeat protein